MNKKAREEIVKYCVLQLKELISFLEEVTKKKFDYDRLSNEIFGSVEHPL